MQLYDDRRKMVGVIAGYRERAVTKTLDTGDKELTFEYPSNGRMVGVLREEYYIRTKEDEYVLKAVEFGEQYNKYTAVLNVEELEGHPFQWGFDSQESTIRECLGIAFADTDWAVGECTVTKKRTVVIEEPTTAWDVLKTCLSAYRCECEIDTLQKVVNIHEQIGQDRGCYFMEGVNIRKLSANSDTYEFYTRLIPIGKDITLWWPEGQGYLENYQYSEKEKTCVWKDERYTDMSSLMEDAQAKLDELSKPYRAYAVDVVDLASANPEYRGILDYSIGDTVTMVSKRMGIREKQRIVKIVEYPENPEKNTVELSNKAKTFAQVQQEETEAALKNYVKSGQYAAGIGILEDRISAKVSVEDFGTMVEQNPYCVKIAWNKNSEYIQFEGNGITLYNGSVDDSQKRTVFDYSGEHFYRDGYYIGKIGTNRITDNENLKGLVFDLESQAAYMTWAWRENSEDEDYLMRWTYCAQQCGDYEAGALHAGADIDMHYFKLKNVSWEDGGVTATIEFVQILEVDGSGKIVRWGEDGMMQFKNGILTDLKYYSK